MLDACGHFFSVIESVERLQEEVKIGISNCSIFKYTYEDGQFTFEKIIRPLPSKE